MVVVADDGIYLLLYKLNNTVRLMVSPAYMLAAAETESWEEQLSPAERHHEDQE